MSSNNDGSGITADLKQVATLVNAAVEIHPVAPRGKAMAQNAVPVELNEVGIADALVRESGSRIRFNHSSGYWLVWDGNRWRRDETGKIIELIKIIIRRASEETRGSERRTARKAAFVGGVDRLARSDQRVAITAEDLDTNPMLLGCPGCEINLETGKRSPPDPNHLITRIAGVAPEDGPCPLFLRFLMEATGGDEDVIKFLQLLCGYILTGHTSEHVLVFLFGPGGNGKSVFLNILTRILGDYAATAAMNTFVAARGERHSTELAMLAGARFVTASETQEGRDWDESKIKTLTGGDPVTARFMRKDNFTYRPQFKLVLSGNHQPVLRNVDPAIWRRLLMVQFTHTPAKPDTDLESKLWAGGAPQILHWAILGCLEWQEEGLPRPSAIVSATENYFSDMDLFGDWLSTKCKVGMIGDATPAVDLFASWKIFADAAGERPGTAKALGARLRRQGLNNRSQRIEGKVVKAWLGISLRHGVE